MNKEELRKYLVKDKNINGLTFDKYVEKVENMTRAVIEERPTNFREIDVFSRLIMDRIIFLGMGIYFWNLLIQKKTYYYILIVQEVQYMPD